MLQQLLGDGQIDERRMNVSVTQVGGKIGQAALRINSLTVPSGDAVNNESVPLMPRAALSSACRLPDYADYLQKTAAGRGSGCVQSRHNQRPSRKANSLSSGQNRGGLTSSGAVRESAFSFKRMLAGAVCTDSRPATARSGRERRHAAWA